MPYKEKPVTKLFYSIGEVAEKFSVNTSLIRFWEKEFAIIKPHKNKKGNRLFTDKDLESFALIYDLVKKKGYTLDGAKKALRAQRGPLSERHKLVSKLEEILRELKALKAIL
jgi:DNA-binding transcriptional MerR regulator